MGPANLHMSIAAPGWTAAGALPHAQAVRAKRRTTPKREHGLSVSLLISAAAHAVAAATLGTIWLSLPPAPRGDGRPVQATVSVTVTAPPAPALPPVTPPPAAVRKPQAAFQPPAVIAPRLIATRANPAAPPAFTVPTPKQVFVARVPLLPVMDSGPAEPAVSAADASDAGTGSGATDGVPQTVPVVRARPDYAQCSPPQYPKIARQRGWQGVVILWVEVLPDGSVGALGIVNSSGHRALDDASVEAVQGWKFLPARVGGTPLRSRVEVPVSFHLKKG